jgi:C-terminal processing protease CtpA/Prc
MLSARRDVCGAVLWTCGLVLSAGPLLAADPPLSSAQYVADFDELWNALEAGYAYFDKKAVDWPRVREIHRPRAAAARSREEFIAVLEGVLEELYDHHAALGTNTPHSPRLVPTGTDIWAEWSRERAVIVEVRRGSEAEKAGLRAGMTITSVNGAAVDKAVQGRLGQGLTRVDPAARDWALRVLLAGRHDEEPGLQVEGVAGEIRLGRGQAPAPKHRLEATRLPSGIGLIRLANSLGDDGLIADFDAALLELRDTRGLVLDLRDTPSGGNTTIARAIMGRFVEAEAPYQRHASPAEERQYGVKRTWVEIVAPRGPFAYRAPVAVLVSHWTGSMGEGLAIGMDAIGAATVVGTRMAGLLGATYGVRLAHSGITFHAPAETLFHVNGTPREDFVPPVLVDLATSHASDPILEAGLAVITGRP